MGVILGFLEALLPAKITPRAVPAAAKGFQGASRLAQRTPHMHAAVAILSYRRLLKAFLLRH
jgi:hypothetical protein